MAPDAEKDRQKWTGFIIPECKCNVNNKSVYQMFVHQLLNKFIECTGTRFSNAL